MHELDIRPVTANRWPDLERLFGPNGAYSGCWCMFLRESAKQFDANCPNGGLANKVQLEEIVRSGAVPGLLAYDDDAPIGWVSVSPREEYVRVLRSPVHRPIDELTGVWAIVCFFIAKNARGKGVADALLAAAIDHAKAGGARIIEAYPIDPVGHSPPRKLPRQPAAQMWRGSIAQFERAGFGVVARRKPAKPIVRLIVNAVPL